MTTNADADTVSDGWDELKKSAKKASTHVSRYWAGVADSEDVEQEIMVRILKSKSTRDAALDMSERNRDSLFFKIGKQVVSQEMDDYTAFTGQIFYSTGHVRALLGRGVLVGRGRHEPEDKCDLEIALATLSKAHKNALAERYVEGIRPETSADKQRLYRAVDKLTIRMNGSRSRRNYEYEVSR